MRGETQTALGRLAMLGVLGAKGLEETHLAADANRELHEIHAVAGANVFQEVGGGLDVMGRTVVIGVEHLQHGVRRMGGRGSVLGDETLGEQARF